MSWAGVGGPGNTGNSGAVGGVASGGMGGTSGTSGTGHGGISGSPGGTSGGAQAAAGPGGVGSGHAGMGPGGIGNGHGGISGSPGGTSGGAQAAAGPGGVGSGHAGMGPGGMGGGSMGGGFGGGYGGGLSGGGFSGGFGAANPGLGIGSSDVGTGSAHQSNKGDFGAPSIGTPGGPPSVGRPATVGGISGMMSDFGFTPGISVPGMPNPGSKHEKGPSRNFNKDQTRATPPVSLNNPKAWPRDFLMNPQAIMPMPGMRPSPSVILGEPTYGQPPSSPPMPQGKPTVPGFPSFANPTPTSSPPTSPFAGWDSTIDQVMSGWGKISDYFAGERARGEFAEGRRGAGLGNGSPGLLAHMLRDYGGGRG